MKVSLFDVTSIVLMKCYAFLVLVLSSLCSFLKCALRSVILFLFGRSTTQNGDYWLGRLFTADLRSSHVEVCLSLKATSVSLLRLLCFTVFKKPKPQLSEDASYSIHAKRASQGPVLDQELFSSFISASLS